MRLEGTSGDCPTQPARSEQGQLGAGCSGPSPAGSSVSPYWLCQMLQSFSHLCGPLLDALQYPHLPLVLGSPDRVQHSRSGPRRAEQGRSVGSCHPPASPFLTQPPMLLAAFVWTSEITLP